MTFGILCMRRRELIHFIVITMMYEVVGNSNIVVSMVLVLIFEGRKKKCEKAKQ